MAIVIKRIVPIPFAQFVIKILWQRKDNFIECLGPVGEPAGMHGAGGRLGPQYGHTAYWRALIKAMFNSPSRHPPALINDNSTNPNRPPFRPSRHRHGEVVLARFRGAGCD